MSNKQGREAVRAAGGERASPLTSAFVYALAVVQTDLEVRRVLTSFALSLAYEEDEVEAAREREEEGRRHRAEVRARRASR